MIRILLTLVVVCFLSGTSFPAFSTETLETRYCGQPKRDASGSIIRSHRVHMAFRKLYPCPSTGLTAGACPGWQVDHVLPLAGCFCDSVSNLQWLPIEIKTCKEPYCKDRFERRIYQCKPEDR